MPDSIDPSTQALNDDSLQRRLEVLQAAHPELEPLAALVLLALRESESPREKGITTSLLSRRLDIEHALIRRAAADLEAGEWVSAEPVSAASPALRLSLLQR